MATHFSQVGNSATLTAILVERFVRSYEVNHVVHRILESYSPAVIYREGGLSEGTLRILCTDSEAASSLAQMHRGVGAITLDDDAPDNMLTYVPVGTVRIVPIDGLEQHWLEVDFREVYL